MYIVELKNGSLLTEIHGTKPKLKSGKIVKGINTIDSFTFSMSPSNPGFNLINEFSTLVTAYNTNKERYDFIGRVLYAETTMDESGLITKTVTCESVLGYLCDSWQSYVDIKNWTSAELLQHLLDCHNLLVEPDKQFKVGIVEAKDNNDNLYQAVQRENTWDAIRTKLIDKIGGELRVRIEEDGMYLDYLDQIGEIKQTEIALSVNMKSITREQDPTAFVTRLIPLGCKLKTTVEVEDENGWKTEEKETEHRLDISSVNDGKTYIDDEQAIAVYGIHVGVVEWDDVTDPSNLKSKGEAWIKENNKVQVKYAITALDLSLIGKAYDDFDVGNYYPIKNSLIFVDDVARVIKKNIDVCEEVKSTMEVGDNFKTLSDIQREQAEQIKQAQSVGKETSTLLANINKRIESLDDKVDKQAETFSSEIKQLSDSIKLEVSGSLGSKASIILSVGENKYSGEMDLEQIRKAFENDPTAISISAGTLTFNSNTLIINSSHFTLDSEGKVTATGGKIAGWDIDDNSIHAGTLGNSGSMWLCRTGTTTSANIAQSGSINGWCIGVGANFGVTKDGILYCRSAQLYGNLTSESTRLKAELHSGGLNFHYDDEQYFRIYTGIASDDSKRTFLSLSQTDNELVFMRSVGSNSGRVGYRYGYVDDNYETPNIFMEEVSFRTSAYFNGSTYLGAVYLRNNAFIKSVDYDGNVGEEMLGYSSERVTVGSVGCATMLRGTTVYLKNTSTTVTSDRNAKNSIEILPEAYETFIDMLDPVRFKYNEGNSGRYHVGYIAQDVKAALEAAGLNTTDFAGYVDIERSGELGLSYDEFIALLHKKIKRLESRISELESVRT